MARESLTACEAGIKNAKVKLTSKRLTQEKLAAKLGISRQPIANFFGRKAVDRTIFVDICEQLELNWEEIAGQPKSPNLVSSPHSVSTDIDALVNQVREKVTADIQKRCGWMRVLDMTHPIGLNDIYTDVNILEKITGRRRLEIAQLLENCNTEDFERFGLNQVVEKRVSGLSAVKKYSKLMILGKPGAGKTTFLKRIAIQCNNGHFFADHVPIFITLKDFAEARQQPGLLQYINNQFARNDISDQEITKTLLLQGRAIVLLDGLDEVRQADNDRVLREIRDFSTQYDANYFVMTCRIASKEYTFEQFIEVEVADFDDKQIAEFTSKWFQTKDPKKAQQFIQKLEENKRIKELATNPLLLTLLCLLFGESTDFPDNRAELYQEGVDVLLKKWDGTRSIERDQVYQRLSLKRKEDLLSKIALETFEEGNYFFKERLVEGYISDYIQNLPDAQTDPEALLLDSKAVLKSIEAQHGLLVERAKGIYSFSHLTFHEFFTARNIALSRNPQQAFQQLVSQITDKRWREVFLLTVGKLNNADDLLQLMKQQIDGLLGTDKKLQKFLTWVNLKSSSVEAPYKRATIRALYFASSHSSSPYISPDLDLDLDLNFSLDLNLSRSLDRSLNLSRSRFFKRSRFFDLSCSLSRSLGLDLLISEFFDLDLSCSLDRSLDRSLKFDLDSELQRKLQELKKQLPDISSKNAKNVKQWWQANGQAWTEQLRNVMIEHRNIGHNWQFNNDQQQLLQQYYDANKLLVDCLNSECYVSRSVRQEIEDTLLLPVNRTNSL
jgi:predicted NACHT family NTPase